MSGLSVEFGVKFLKTMQSAMLVSNEIRNNNKVI